MYLPRSVPLSRPHVAMWFGRSGKRYDFAVSRAHPMWLGQPVVYVLVRYDGESAVPLFIGRATAADPQLGGAGSEAVEAWEQAMALGMTHLHLRFEACSEEDRAAEVEDLVAAIRPPLNEADGMAPALDGVEPTPKIAAVADAALDAAPLPPADAVRPGRHGRWLGRTASALAARCLRWRSRTPTADAPAGRVTVRADAVAVEESSAVLAVSHLEPATPAEPSVVAVEADAQSARSAFRQRLGLGGEDIVVLFAGEITGAAGADLAVEAMATVHADAACVRLVLVGEGPLRAELESRAWHGGFAHACRFMGDLPAEAFAEAFAACDAIVIPARVRQDPALAEHALGAGRPVLTTHQAQLDCVRHAENGFVTYDNPGSLVWGLREIRALAARCRAPAALAA